MIDVRSLPSVAFEHRHALPDLMAVYVVVGESANIWYVGSTASLRTRWKSHHRRFQMKRVDRARIHWCQVDDPSALRETEAEWINRLEPSLNRQPVTDRPLVLIGTMVPEPHAAALKLLARNEDRSVSKIVKKLVEESPQFQEALRQVEVA